MTTDNEYLDAVRSTNAILDRMALNLAGPKLFVYRLTDRDTEHPPNALINLATLYARSYTGELGDSETLRYCAHVTKLTQPLFVFGAERFRAYCPPCADRIGLVYGSYAASDDETWTCDLDCDRRGDNSVLFGIGTLIWRGLVCDKCLEISDD